MGWAEEKEGKKKDGWTGGMSMDIEKQQKKRKMGKRKKEKEKWLEQPHARTMIV